MSFPTPLAPSPHPPGPGARAAPSSAARAAAPVATTPAAAPPAGGSGKSSSSAGNATSSLELGIGGVEGRGAVAPSAAGFASPFKPAESIGSLAATLAARDRGPLVRKGLLDLGPFSSARGGEGGRRWRGSGGGCGGAPGAAVAAAVAPAVRCCRSIPLESALAVRRNLHDLPPILSREGEGREEAARARAAGRGLFFGGGGAF